MQSNLDYREPIGSQGLSIPGTAAQPARGEGVDLCDLPLGAVLEVETGHHTYRVENRGDGKVLIAGHPRYCPEPVLVDLHGSVGEGSLLKLWFIGRGMRMEFVHPQFGAVWTSRIREIRERKAS
jgi:hypothetical protein